MSKILIDNRTDLSYKEVGNLLDNLFENQKGQTNYVGKWCAYEFHHHKKIYTVETMVMKRYFKIFIMESEMVKDVSDV